MLILFETVWASRLRRKSVRHLTLCVKHTLKYGYSSHPLILRNYNTLFGFFHFNKYTYGHRQSFTRDLFIGQMFNSCVLYLTLFYKFSAHFRQFRITVLHNIANLQQAKLSDIVKKLMLWLHTSSATGLSQQTIFISKSYKVVEGGGVAVRVRHN